MKKIRFKKDIECRLTVKVDGEAVSLESSELTLVLIRPDRTRVRVAIESVEENVLHFYITPNMQNKVGVYNLELWRDVGSGHQTICDVPNAFRLVPLSQQEGGESKDNLETGTVGVTANFTGEYIVIDSLDSYSTDAALSANQGRILDDKISDLGDSLDEETEARENADTELSEAITSEAEARSDADTKLQEAIDTLAQNMGSADSALHEAINAEKEARADADTALQEAVDAEAEARADADTALQEAVYAEAEARADADTALQEAVDAEAEARKAADELIEKVIVSLKEKLEALSGDTVSWQTNDDYLIAFVDNEDNLLLGITKDAKVYIPLGLPDGIIGLRELLTEWIPVIEYMTDEEVKEMFEED